MRVDSTNDRYVTETMIDLNLDLNEEIDFDFFDNVETPSKEPLKKETVNISLSKPGSPEDKEEDEDVQVNPHLLSHELRLKHEQQSGRTVKDVNSSVDSLEEPLSTGTENEGRFVGSLDEGDPDNTEIIKTTVCEHVSVDNATLSDKHVVEDREDSSSLQVEKTSSKNTSCSRVNDSSDKHKSLGSKNVSSTNRIADGRENAPSSSNTSLSQIAVKYSENAERDAFHKKPSNTERKLSQDDKVSSKSSENHDENASSKSSKSLKSEGSGSGYDSDEGCPFEGSDSDELLLGVHTLTIIPRESEETIPQRAITCEEAVESNEPHMIHSTTCEKASMTARSSSGYSSASCKAHGCIFSRGEISRAESQITSRRKICTPDTDEFIKSFQKIQPTTPASFTCSEKYSAPKKRKRRNMSFSNEELQRIERENAILLNKIVLQQRTRPSVVHKYERRVTSNAINRARQLKKIESENEVCFISNPIFLLRTVAVFFIR